jgi:hypothetical protein
LAGQDGARGQFAAQNELEGDGGHSSEGRTMESVGEGFREFAVPQGFGGDQIDRTGDFMIDNPENRPHFVT